MHFSRLKAVKVVRIELSNKTKLRLNEVIRMMGTSRESECNKDQLSSLVRVELDFYQRFSIVKCNLISASTRTKTGSLGY